MIKILLLDDDELANELVVFILKLAGVKNYDICTSGQDGLKYLDKCKAENDFPDIMFVDVNMPGMNGFEFIELYEKDYRSYSPDARVIMLTNSVLAKEKKHAVGFESVYDFWNKPLTQQRLIKLIETVKADNL